jgi:hypothetical protein
MPMARSAGDAVEASARAVSGSPGANAWDTVGMGRISGARAALNWRRETLNVARGWESKDVGDRQSMERPPVLPPQHPSVDERMLINRLRALELDRARVQHELDTATHERFRHQLQASLIHLDGQIAALKTRH